MYSEWELVAAYSSAKVGHHRNLRRLSRHVSQNENRIDGNAAIKKWRVWGNKSSATNVVFEKLSRTDYLLRTNYLFAQTYNLSVTNFGAEENCEIKLYISEGNDIFLSPKKETEICRRQMFCLNKQIICSQQIICPQQIFGFEDSLETNIGSPESGKCNAEQFWVFGVVTREPSKFSLSRIYDW